MSLFKQKIVHPFNKWRGHSSSLDPDTLFPESVTFNSYQLAVQATLELMGTRLSPIPVILPVTASPAIVSAVLRSGAAPVLLDVSEATLQMKPEQLQEALQELKDAIVVLDLPGGQRPDQALMKQVLDLPTIVTTHVLPDPLEALGSFTIYNLQAMIGDGGVVVHKFSQQRNDLRIIRSGNMGHAGALPWPQVSYVADRLSQVNLYKKNQGLTARQYITALRDSNKDGMIVFDSSLDWPYFLVRVDPDIVGVHLQEAGIETKLGCYPVHLMGELKDRWQETPEYPSAMKLKEELLALPTTLQGITPKEIVKLILEVS